MKNKVRNFVKEEFDFINILYKKYYNRKLSDISEEEIKTLLSKEYERVFKRVLNWETPRYFTEKMQVYKLKELRNEIYSNHADKIKAKEIAASIIGDDHIIPTLKVWDQVSDMDLEKIERPFVLKTNHAAGNVYFVDHDTTPKQLNKYKRLMKHWMQLDYGLINQKSFELHYQLVDRKVFAEPIILDKNGALNDYKFICFDGEPIYVWVDTGRNNDHRRNIYDLNWNLQPWTWRLPATDNPIERPNKLEEMIEMARKLSQGFKQVRIDLYNVDGHIYFGEFTFTSFSGFAPISDDTVDLSLGEMWQLD